MKSTKRVLSLLAALCLLVCVFAGCQPEAAAPNPGTPGDAPAGETPTAAASGEPVEIKIEVFERGTAGYAPANDNFWTDWIQENYGTPNNVTVTFVPVPRSEEVNQLNVMMASNNAPDLVFTYDVNLVANYAIQGGLHDVGEILAANGPNLKEFLGEEVLQYGLINGKQYSIPGKRAIIGAMAHFIRKDWLDAVEMEVPTNTDEFYEVLKAFKEQDPSGKGDNLIPFSISMARGWGYYGIMHSFVEPMTEEEFYTKSSTELAQPGYKEGLRFMNKLYNEGLVNQDFTVVEDTKPEIVNGNVGFYSGMPGADMRANPPVLTALRETEPDAEYIAVDPFVNSEGKRPKYSNPPFGVYMMFPAASDKPAEVIKYLDWMSGSDVLMTLQNGFVGETYEMQDDIPVPLPYEGEKMLYAASNSDFTPIVNGKYMGSPEMNAKVESINCPGFEQLYLDSVKVAETDMPASPNWMGLVNEAKAKYSAQLTTKIDEAAAKLITCAPEEYDALWETVYADYLQSGAQEVMDENARLYQELLTLR